MFLDFKAQGKKVLFIQLINYSNPESSYILVQVFFFHPSGMATKIA